MPVRVAPFNHPAQPIQQRFADNELDVLLKANQSAKTREIEILQSSFDANRLPSNMISSRNGLVDSIVHAYNRHHHLQIRPDDIWFAILTQINIYINAHAEELRHMFVAHEGQKKLEIVYGSENRYTVDFADFATRMTGLIEKNIVDDELKEWIIPSFTTTTANDVVVSSILMMSTMQKYFKYYCRTMCGIPSVTLLGEKHDYEKILSKLDKLESFVEETRQFASLLRPVIRQMIWTFDDPEKSTTVDFWRSILHVHHGSGGTKYSGWVSAFCFWDNDGKCMWYPSRNDHSLVLDGVGYHMIGTENVPSGWAKVPVTIIDNGEVVEAEMLAGSIGIVCSSSARQNVFGQASLDAMQPEVGWWIYEVKPQAEGETNDPLVQPANETVNSGTKGQTWMSSFFRGQVHEPVIHLCGPTNPLLARTLLTLTLATCA
ncbi:hypothetical protein H2198_002249 [Neophaeococcomyces mojaviensis]|uniref:Uncharacterized protein n=1 Tax=Neophaeococcomyces mojaviensis TaxID=3383035 RepID=A0ACC3AEJ9_9EURO|nr:hypothetical protein H2198_002249 [Knufia sp. JES_112]